MSKDLTIRNSTAEFLIFTSQAGEESIEVKYAEGTVWLSQKMMAKLFEVTIPTINEHIKNIYQSQELEENSTIRKFRIVQNEANRDVQRPAITKHLKNIFESKELIENSVSSILEHTAQDDKAHTNTIERGVEIFINSPLSLRVNG